MPIAVAGASLVGGILGGSAASHAANTQADAANNAAALQANSSKEALDFQKQAWGQTQQEMNPYLQAGYGGLANLQSLLGITPQGNTFNAAGAANQMGQPTSGPRYSMGNDYKGGLFGSWGGSDWKYSGQKGQQDVYTRSNGSPAYDFYGPAGWSRGGAGAYSGFDQGTTPGAHSNIQRTPGSPGAGQGTPLSSLVNPALGGFGSLMQPYGEKFTAPTDVTVPEPLQHLSERPNQQIQPSGFAGGDRTDHSEPVDKRRTKLRKPKRRHPAARSLRSRQ